MTNTTSGNIDQNQKKEPVLTPGSEKSPEQLRLEKEKNDQSANNNPKSDSKVDNEVEKKA
jgi:hypothetical protein